MKTFHRRGDTLGQYKEQKQGDHLSHRGAGGGPRAQRGKPWGSWPSRGCWAGEPGQRPVPSVVRGANKGGVTCTQTVLLCRQPRDVDKHVHGSPDVNDNKRENKTQPEDKSQMSTGN